MSSALTKSLLNAPVEELVAAVNFQTMDKEQFQSLGTAIELLRAKVENKETITKEECRLIVVYFRERRGRAFTVKKASTAKKAVKTQLPKKKEEKQKLAKMSSEELLNLLDL